MRRPALAAASAPATSGRLARMALAALAAAAALPACKAIGSDEGRCGDACKATEQRFGLTDRTIHDREERTFVAGGVEYTLVRFEYGETEDCDALGDCSYSVYCGFRTDGKDYPLEVSWVTDADALFDPAEYCADGELSGCELPGQTLPILDDPDFEDWLYAADPDEDALADCFADYW